MQTSRPSAILTSSRQPPWLHEPQGRREPCGRRCKLRPTQKRRPRCDCGVGALCRRKAKLLLALAPPPDLPPEGGRRREQAAGGGGEERGGQTVLTVASNPLGVVVFVFYFGKCAGLEGALVGVDVLEEGFVFGASRRAAPMIEADKLVKRQTLAPADLFQIRL